MFDESYWKRNDEIKADYQRELTAFNQATGDIVHLTPDEERYRERLRLGAIVGGALEQKIWKWKMKKQREQAEAARAEKEAK